MKFSRISTDGQLATLRMEGEKRDAMRRATNEQLPFLEFNALSDKTALAIIPEATAKDAKIAIINKKDKELVVVAYSTKNPKAKELIHSLKKEGFALAISITTESALEEYWSGYKKLVEEKQERKEISARVQLEGKKLEEVRSKIKNIDNAVDFFEKLEEEIKTSDLLGYILGTALALKASDIHIEYTTKKEALLRFRIDGALKDITNLKERSVRLLVNRVKLLAGLKLNIKNIPQDGRFTIEEKEGDIEVRSSVVPAEFGEAIVMRVLDPAIIGLELSDLGLRGDDEDIIRQELKRPSGMILVTGPTGSGKTTTLYAFLKRVQSSIIKIITIEDPIEYHLKGIQQTQIDKNSGYTFSVGLRSILRQDPDVILVGEIRDSETASVSMNAALTGHLVFSTLHTNNAAGAIPRLVDLGVKQSTIGPAIALIIGQRLVRRLCPKCKKEEDIDDKLREKIRVFIERLPKRVSRENMDAQLYQAAGCKECEDGFSGRIAVIELLKIGDVIDVLIREKATELDIQKTAIEKLQMVLMQQDGIIKVIEGITTLEEVERATGPIEW